jgi:hypothetical protein
MEKRLSSPPAVYGTENNFIYGRLNDQQHMALVEEEAHAYE